MSSTQHHQFHTSCDEPVFEAVHLSGRWCKLHSETNAEVVKGGQLLVHDIVLGTHLLRRQQISDGEQLPE